ncbi:MAG: glycosyltransferase family 2 protein [Kaiparowitsia implicata GSE-PSE-MK54-09C]|jgi:1,2-diacylglycerol 3-beta-glucosyltransferase|nr:glycosyltransferase family 2 protein [Kaiparowitsia implicata GSE-PSE-MK54-09C]
MPNSAWHDSDSYDDLETISSLVSDLSESEDVSAHFYRGLAGRRQKAAAALTIVWSGTIALHLFSWGYWAVMALTTMMGIHILRLLTARQQPLPEPLPERDPAKLPFVSLMVAAKNEETVIASLVKALCRVDYPASRYELWVIDDHSTDRTPQVLHQLQQEYPQLKVLTRSSDAGGGKSGALNQACALAAGDIIGVFDADAQIPSDMLRRVLTLFQQEQVGAVQMRKAIAQAERTRHSSNLWIRGQMAEMAIDSFYQQQRIAIGGVGELRGNGMFVRRAALDQCGNWNEETITDDLDLTFRLHLAGWDIEFLMHPAVVEEGVTQARGLWHQRNRWAEGGYQRYLDYWRLIIRNRLGLKKTIDLLAFFVLQYILPTATVPDLMMAIARSRPPMLAPVTSLSVAMSMMGMYAGLRRIQAQRAKRSERGRSPALIWQALHQAILGTVYMVHWLPVMSSTTARISVRPKQLKWVKTAHHGTDEVWLDVSEQEG